VRHAAKRSPCISFHVHSAESPHLSPGILAACLCVRNPLSDPALHAFAVTGESGISIWSEPGLSKASQYVVSDLVALARERPQLDTIEEANAMVVFPLPEAPVRITSD
jgi:hypothetical protein